MSRWKSKNERHRHLKLQKTIIEKEKSKDFLNQVI